MMAESIVGRLISHNHVDGKIALTKVTCITTGKQLPGNQIYFEDEIIPNSFLITDEVTNERIKVDKGTLKEKKSKSVEERGLKRQNSTVPTYSDVQKESFQLASFLKYLEKADDSSNLPSNMVTTNPYKCIGELVPREEWRKAVNRTRPTSYIIVTSLGEMFNEAIYRINSEEAIGVAFTGANIGRDGELFWIQISTSDVVYLFDVCAMGHSCISYGLGQIFSSQTVLKVTYDCRWMSDLLFHQYNVKILNVFDVQVASVLSYRALHGGDLPAYVKSLQSLVEQYLLVGHDEYHVYKIRQAFKDSEEQLWATRPLHSYLLDSLAKTVSYLVELKKPLLDEMMNDFYVAMNSYVSVIRDQSKTERELPQQEPYRLPAIFTHMQRRDRRTSQLLRHQDDSHIVNPEGFIETYDNPKELHYRRDSINHSRMKKQQCDVIPQAKKVVQKYVVPSHLLKDLPATQQKNSSSSSSERQSNIPASSPNRQSNMPARSPNRQSNIPASSPNGQLNIPARSPNRQSNISASSPNGQPNIPASKHKRILHSSSQFLSNQANDSLKDHLESPSSHYGAAFDPDTVGNKKELPTSVHSQNRASNATLSGLPSSSDIFSTSSTSSLADRNNPTFNNPTSRRPKSVGRGKSPFIFEKQRIIQTSGDSDSGVESGNKMFRPQTQPTRDRVGEVAGFQNFELMGTAPLCLDNTPEDFDIRSTNVRELQLLKENKLKRPPKKENILLKGLAFQNKEDIPVVRQLVCRDGSIEDMEGSVILNGPTNNWCTPHPNSHFNWDAPSSQSAQRICGTEQRPVPGSSVTVKDTAPKDEYSDIEWDD
ncbi:EXD1 [Bugula neritina]|uniref:EXD1 n=1 Tax=Bugula neritina TaxID=10212 RepID=A0A7J7J307_BUGNE|nr:EXD1 [Bugula neritina]